MAFAVFEFFLRFVFFLLAQDILVVKFMTIGFGFRDTDDKYGICESS